jgi:hypothetical protein
VKFLLFARDAGVRFARTATIGRQQLLVDARRLRRLLADFGVNRTREEVEALTAEASGFAEPFLRLLGAAEVRSFDASDYESATDIVDLNDPILERYKGRFTAVIDGGALEHVFNFPVAIRSSMEMVEAGGHMLAITPANNFSGHGFYQFSPELFFRIFSEPNGFRLERMMIFEDRPGADWFDVIDPVAAGERVMFVNATPTYLLVIARRVAVVPVLAAPPQQSDYVVAWRARRADAAPPAGGGFIRRAMARAAARSRRFLARLRGAGSFRLGESLFFRRVKPRKPL